MGYREGKKEIQNIGKILLKFLPPRNKCMHHSISSPSKHQISCRYLNRHVTNSDGNGCHLLVDSPIPQNSHLFPKGSGIHTLRRRQSLIRHFVDRHTDHTRQCRSTHCFCTDRFETKSLAPNMALIRHIRRHAHVPTATWLSLILHNAERGHLNVR